MKLLQGLGVALITPFNEDETVDFSSLEKLVNYNIGGGVDYLVVLGTTAESATLEAGEKREIIECIKQTNNHRLPLILGIGGNHTAEIIRQLQTTDLEAFSAILSVSPYYNKPSQEGIFQHYKALAKNSPKPIIIYNVPGRTSSNIEATTTLRMANEIENLLGIKEASGNFLQSTDILKNKPQDFILTSGDDEYALPVTLAGGDGVISVLGQALPEKVSQMIRLGLENKVQDAYQIHYQIQSLIRLIFAEGNPTGIKALLALQGIIKTSNTRLPLVKATQQLMDKLSSELKKL
ncbi:4-hydroxy-tetrahydrodipicolinate synthase [Apibacter muscae]|uniref:4-hydroxy-tetrahydrodipicolinate synthase n=1 Tax=Apibacter muscae TaxID=2509004 RepID=UPI0011AC1754|nr:4-hydroxy-tetrahydrodipicolinate synthase [Apibacter muscae]TWP22967.1 4-hydroxy-tetrahydrodipicolinate synthase [Apibacter muscae]